MNEPLTRCLIDLASDPDRISQFIIDPVATLDAAGLSDEEKAVVLAGDSAGLRRALGGESLSLLTRILRGKKGGRKKPSKKKGPAKKKSNKTKM